MSNLKSRAVKAAEKFLACKGYDVLETEWSCFAGEIDIIARDGDTIVFADVNAKDAGATGFPEESRSKSDRERLEKIALAYLADHDTGELRIRFDDIALVVLGGNRAIVRHHVNALGAAA